MNKSWIIKEISQLCVGLCEKDVCDDYTCSSHPKYNWLNPNEPLNE